MFHLLNSKRTDYLKFLYSIFSTAYERIRQKNINKIKSLMSSEFEAMRVLSYQVATGTNQVPKVIKPKKGKKFLSYKFTNCIYANVDRFCRLVLLIKIKNVTLEKFVLRLSSYLPKMTKIDFVISSFKEEINLMVNELGQNRIVRNSQKIYNHVEIFGLRLKIFTVMLLKR
jgi:hypothetical protein